MSDLPTIKRTLASRAQSVCEHLLPAGKVISGDWCVGSVEGEPGKSLRVALTGAKAGIWSDFAQAIGGDLIDLWMAVLKLTLVAALDDIRGWLGIEKPEFHRNPRREYVRPPKPQCTKPTALSPVMMYLTEGRNIPPEVLEQYKIAEQGDNIIFPFLRDSELIMAKSRPARDGAHPVPTAKDCEPILFGWQAIGDNEREIFITEGEIDALSMAAYGYPALSLPFGGGGGGKHNWIENEYDRLDRFETIYLCLDMDDVGKQAVEAVSERLGRHRCRVVDLPYKDANDCLVAGCTAQQMASVIQDAATLDPPQLSRPLEHADKVMEIFFPPDGEAPGYPLPFANADKMRFRPGEFTVWSGPSGSGKTQILSHAQVHWMGCGARICSASLEMAPAWTLMRAVKQSCAVEGQPTRQMVESALKWIDAGLLIYNVVGKSSLAELLEVFDYARAKYGCDVFVIDSLMRLGLSADDYEGQEKAVFSMVDWVLSRAVHLHLVAHTRKADTRGPNIAPGVEDIKGAMEVGANAFNILTIFRNRQLEETQAALRERQANGEKLTDKEESTLGAAAVILNVAKQRNGDWEGKTGLWFNQGTYTYRSARDSPHPRRYVPEEKFNDDFKTVMDAG